MTFQYSSLNLPELALLNVFDPLHYLATSLKDNTVKLSKDSALKLFEHISSADLDKLINALAISQLEQEYLYYHHRLKCLLPSQMNRLIDLGILSTCLKSIKPLPCLACLLGKSKKKPWKTKSSPPSIRKHSSIPGEAVSVDQLVSAKPGIKPQSKGLLTNVPIVGVQIFVDHSSSLPFLYTYLLESFSLDETLKAKVAFERMAATHNVQILHY